MFRIQEPYFPTYYAYAQHSGFCDEKREDLMDRLARGLLAAELVHNKWNKRVWQRPRHMLGILCHEERRQWFAYLLLGAYDHLDEAVEAVISAAPLAPQGRPPPPRPVEEHNKDPPEVQDILLRMDLADEELLDRWSEGFRTQEFTNMFIDNGFADAKGKLLPVVKKELLLLASLPPQDTENDPLLSVQHTPFLYEQLAKVLFVGAAHNLPVEAYVSRVANISKIHSGIKPVCLAAMFMYKVRLEGEKGERRAGSLRVLSKERQKADGSRGGILRKEGCNREQLRALMTQAHARATALQARRAEYFAKGEENLGRRVAGARRAAQQRVVQVSKRLIDELASTAKFTKAGNRRKRAFSRKECEHFVPDDKNLAKGGQRGSKLKNKDVAKRARQEIAAGRRELVETKKRNKRTRRLTAAQRVRGEQRFDAAERQAKQQRKAAAAEHGGAGGDAGAAGRPQRQPARLAAQKAQSAESAIKSASCCFLPYSPGV